MTFYKLLVCAAAISFSIVSHAENKESNMVTEKQLTFNNDHNCALDNNLNFSPDGKWLCFDTRPYKKGGALDSSETLEKINVNTGEIVTIHKVENPIFGFGPGAAAVSFFPQGDKIVSIHGYPTKNGLKYEQWRRFGSIISPTDGSGKIAVADARDVTTPFTPGALRGGTHRHEPSFDGKWIGFTYNDMIMRNLEKDAKFDLRTIGVTKLGIPVKVHKDAKSENQDGTGFSVLLVKVAHPDNVHPDTEEISRAAEDSWIGDSGYRKNDGTIQLARAFIGDTKRTQPGGSVVTRKEVFVADIPEDITIPGSDGPLEGTSKSFPMPPKGVKVRMITHSDADCGGTVRSSKDGSRLVYSKNDKNGIAQLYLISPLGGEPVQATNSKTSCGSFRWHPSGRFIIYSSGGAVCSVNVEQGSPDFGKSVQITKPTPDAPPTAVVVSPDGKKVAFNRILPVDGSADAKALQIFIADTNL